jgi:PTS system mannose-specific IIC component
MIEATPVLLAGLFVWATVVGLDLVSLPQVMASRPLVAGTVTGIIVGDVQFGVAAGAVLELFAMESLAIGAARYPDYGAATVAAVLTGAGRPPVEALGAAVVLGLLLAGLGGWSLSRLRHVNATAVRRRTASLASGDPVAVRAIHFSSLGRDVIRSSALGALALAAALTVRQMPSLPEAGHMGLSVLVLGGALAGGVSGAVRSGRGTRMRWLGAGGVLGLIITAVMA